MHRPKRRESPCDLNIHTFRPLPTGTTGVGWDSHPPQESAFLRRTVDIDYRTPHGLNQQQMLQLANCDWIRGHLNVILTGPTGTGKSYLACALAHKACLEGFNACYHRLPRLLEELSIARADGRYLKVLNKLKKLDVLVLDDWRLSPLTQTQQEYLFQILDDRIQKRSTIATSQVPVEHWYQSMANPTLADAILDRLVQPAYRIELSGESIRKQRKNPKTRAMQQHRNTLIWTRNQTKNNAPK